MTESQFKQRCRKIAKEHLPDAFIYCPCDSVRAGIPDMLILFQGVFAAVELKLKSNRNKNILLQEQVLATIQKAGGMTWLLRDDGCGGGTKAFRNIVELIKTRAGGNNESNN